MCVCAQSQVQPRLNAVTGCKGTIPANGAMALYSRNSMRLSTGHQSMASLGTPRESSPVDNLQASRVATNPAHRGTKRRRSFWHFGTWNVRSLLDNKGPIEHAWQGPESCQLSEDRRIDSAELAIDCSIVEVAMLCIDVHQTHVLSASNFGLYLYT